MGEVYHNAAEVAHTRIYDPHIHMGVVSKTSLAKNGLCWTLLIEHVFFVSPTFLIRGRGWKGRGCGAAAAESNTQEEEGRGLCQTSLQMWRLGQAVKNAKISFAEKILI